MAIAVVRGFVNHTRSGQSSAAAVLPVTGASHGRSCVGYCADVATARSRFLRLLAMMLTCAVVAGGCGSSKPSSKASSTTTSAVSLATSVSTIANQALRDRLAGRTFIVAKPDGTFPTHLLQPAGNITFVLLGDGSQSRDFIYGLAACNSVSYTGSLDGDHIVITEASTTAAGCSYGGLSWYEPRDAKLALSDDGSTVTVTASDTGQVAYLLLDPARFPVAQGASLVGTYQLTTKRLLVLDQDGTGRILDTVSQVVTCPVTWTPPPALSITPADCPADDELRSPFGPSLAASGEVRQHGSWLFVGSFAFSKVTPAPAPPPVADLLANWPARPTRTFTMADVPVLLPPDRQGRYSLSDGYKAPDSSTPVTAGDHFVQYLVNTTNPNDLLIVDTSLGRGSLDRLGAPIVIQGWPGAWSDNGALTLLSESGRVVLSGTSPRQQADRLTRRVSGAGWDLPGYSPMFEGWRYPPMSRFLVIDADDFRAVIKVTVGGADVYGYELNGPKLQRIEVSGHPASSIESVGTWDVTWSPAPDIIVTVSYGMQGLFDYDTFTALRSTAEAFAQSLQVAPVAELETLLAG
jgi:hypothetical protein